MNSRASYSLAQILNNTQFVHNFSTNIGYKLGPKRGLSMLDIDKIAIMANFEDLEIFNRHLIGYEFV
jgi:hypothetical protein